MNSINFKQFSKQLFFFLLGLFIIQIGVAMFLKLSLGSDPFTVFTQGISNKLHISIGNANRILTFILFLIILCIDRKNINIGTLICVMFTGVFLDTIMNLLSIIPFDSFNIITKIALFAIACIPVSIGFPILKSANLGVAPNDLVYLAIVDYSKRPYSVVRMSTDIVFVIIGFAFKGVVGIGTIMCILLLGPLTQFFFSKIETLGFEI